MNGDSTRDEEVRLPDPVTISVERMIRFGHLADLAFEHSSPSDPAPEDPPLHLTRFGTLMTLSLSFLFSLFEEEANSMNVRRVWLGFDHPFGERIKELENRLEGFREPLRLVRNRYDFHGSLSRAREVAGFSIYQDLGQARELFRLAGDARRLFQEMTNWFVALPKEDRGLADEDTLHQG